MQSLNAIRNEFLRRANSTCFDKYPPAAGKQLLYMDAHTWRQFRADYSVQQLEWRFDFEQQRQKKGQSIRSREFYRLLKEHLQAQERKGASSTE